MRVTIADLEERTGEQTFDSDIRMIFVSIRYAMHAINIRKREIVSTTLLGSAALTHLKTLKKKKENFYQPREMNEKSMCLSDVSEI